MKRIVFLFIIIAISLYSCKTYNYEDICQYEGKQIVDKINPAFGRYGQFKFRVDGTISKWVYVTIYDYERFDLGDTVKCK